MQVVHLYIQRQTASTNTIITHLNHHIATLMLEMQINKTYVDARSFHAIQRIHPIERTPCLVVGRSFIYNLEQILQVLTPRRAAAVRVYGAISPEEQTDNYMKSFADPKYNMDDETDAMQNEEQIAAKMQNLQKRRPQMSGVQGALPGGRKLPVRKPTPMSTFDSDSKFLADAGLDNVDDTPEQPYFSEHDGDSILEEERLDEARKTAGYKPYMGRRTGRR